MDDDDIERMLTRIADAVDHRAMAIGARTTAWEATDWQLTRLFHVCASDREVAAVGTHRVNQDGQEQDPAGTPTGTQRVQTLALRMQAIRAARGGDGGAGQPPQRPGHTEADTEAFVRTELCVLLAEAELDPPLQDAAENATEGPPAAAAPATTSKKATKFTPGLTVRPQEVYDKYQGVKSNQVEQDDGSQAGSASDDEADDEKLVLSEGKRKRTPLLPELLLHIPEFAGRSNPVLNTVEAHEVKEITPKQVKKAYKSFAMVEGMPTFTKASPLLKVLSSSGIEGLDKLQIRLNKLYKDEHADQRQDANTVYHVLNHCLELVSAVALEKKIDQVKLDAMQRDVYLVAALQSQKFIKPGVMLIKELCKTLKLPAIGEMSKYAGMTEELEMVEQKDVLDQLKIMIELNKAVTGKDGVLAGRLNESALGKDDPVRATVHTSNLGNAQNTNRGNNPLLQIYLSSRSSGRRSAQSSATSAASDPGANTSDVVDQLPHQLAIDGMGHVRDFQQKVVEWAILNAIRASAYDTREDDAHQVMARSVMLHQYTASGIANDGSGRGDRPGFSKIAEYPQGGSKSKPKNVDENCQGVEETPGRRSILFGGGDAALDAPIPQHRGCEMGGNWRSRLEVPTHAPTDADANGVAQSADCSEFGQECAGATRDGSVRASSRVEGTRGAVPEDVPLLVQTISGNEVGSTATNNDWNHDRGQRQRQPDTATVRPVRSPTEAQPCDLEAGDGDRSNGADQWVTVHHTCEHHSVDEDGKVCIHTVIKAVRQRRHAVGPHVDYGGRPYLLSPRPPTSTNRGTASDHVQSTVHTTKAGSRSGRPIADGPEEIRSEPIVAQDALQGEQPRHVGGHDSTGGPILEDRFPQGLPPGAHSWGSTPILTQRVLQHQGRDRAHTTEDPGPRLRSGGDHIGQAVDTTHESAQSHGHSSGAGDRRLDRCGVDTGAGVQGDVHRTQAAGNVAGGCFVRGEVRLHPDPVHRVVRTQILFGDVGNVHSGSQGIQGSPSSHAIHGVHTQRQECDGAPSRTTQGPVDEHGAGSGRGKIDDLGSAGAAAPFDASQNVSDGGDSEYDGRACDSMRTDDSDSDFDEYEGRHRPRQTHSGGFGTSSNYGSGPQQQQGMDGGLQHSRRQGDGFVERQIPPLRTPVGNDFHGCMRVAEGRVRTRERQPPRNSTPNSHGLAGGGPTHHPLGDGCVDGRSDRDRAGAGPTRWVPGSVCGRVGDHAVPTEPRWTSTSAFRQDQNADKIAQATPVDHNGVPHSRPEESCGQAFQGLGGCGGVSARDNDFQEHETGVGSIFGRRVCGEMEQADDPVLLLSAQRRTGSGIRFYGATNAPDTGTSVEWGDMDVSPATPKPTHGDLETCSSSKVGGGHNTPILAGGFPGAGVANAQGCAQSNCSDEQFVGTPVGISKMEQVQVHISRPHVDLENMAESDWAAFVRSRQIERGVDPELAQAARLVYKAREGEARGRHLQGPWALLFAELKRRYGGGKIALSDVEFCNVASANATTESGAKRVLSAMRVVARKAYGIVPELAYDRDLRDQVVAIGHDLVPTTPKYTRGVDLQTVFEDIQAQRIQAEDGWKSLPHGSPAVTTFYKPSHANYMTIRNITFFLGRVVCVNRSDDFMKFDPRHPEYMRCYDGEGNLVQLQLRSQELQRVIDTDGFLEVNYKEPKDPRRTGKMSVTTTVRPLRLRVVMNTEVLHLSTPQRVAYLCFVRSLKWLIATMERMHLFEHIETGRFWVNDKQKDAMGRPVPLKATSLSSLVKKQMERVGMQCGSDTDDKEGGKENTTLSGHFLRGHAGSLAYDLSKIGASWNDDEGINRARHTFATFFKCYHRATVLRVKVAFLAVKGAGLDLRFEEAAVL